MNSAWFKRFSFTYLPVSVMGISVTILAIIFLVPVYIAIIRNGHSVSDDLYHMFVYTTCTAFLVEVGSGKSIAMRKKMR